MPESSIPESDPNTAANAETQSQPTIGLPTPPKTMELLRQLHQLETVQYTAIWPIPNANFTQPAKFVGQSQEKLSLQQRQRCLSQVQQKPGQPFLLGDKSIAPTEPDQQVALNCLLAASCPSQQTSAIFELQFSDSTSMQVATQALQKSAHLIQKSGWRLGPPAGPALKTKSTSDQFEFAGQAAPTGFSAAGLNPTGLGAKPLGNTPVGGNLGRSSSRSEIELKQLADRFRNFSRQVHRSLDPLETDLNVCNELCDYLDCDRVSVVRRQRGKFKVHAISGQPSVNQRSHIIQQLQSLAKATLRQGKVFHAPTDENLPNEIQQPLDTFLLTSEVRSLIILPVMGQANDLQQEEADLRKANSSDTIIGGIIIESLKREIDFKRQPEVQATCEVASDAIRNSHQHRQLLFYPLWNWLGHTNIVAWSRRIPLSMIAALVVCGIALLGFWPATFYVSSEGTLVPVVRHRVFAPKNGLVEEIYVKPNQDVTAGQNLIRMRDYDLDSQIQKVKKDLAVVSSNIEVQERWIRTGNKNERYANREDETPLSVLSKERDNLLLQLDLLAKQKQLLLVSSPIDGTVMTWRVDEDLMQRPVPFGRLMMEIAEINGRWKLILNLPDRRIGHLLEAMKQSNEPLEVEFVLAARPERRYRGTLDQVALTTAASQEEGSFVKVEVKVDSEDLDVLQNETEVSAKILCGNASLGYVWLHDIGEFVQKKIFFFTW